MGQIQFYSMLSHYLCNHTHTEIYKQRSDFHKFKICVYVAWMKTATKKPQKHIFFFFTKIITFFMQLTGLDCEGRPLREWKTIEALFTICFLRSSCPFRPLVPVFTHWKYKLRKTNQFTNNNIYFSLMDYLLWL